MVQHWTLGGQETELHSGLPISRMVRSWMSLPKKREAISTYLSPVTEKLKSGGLSRLYMLTTSPLGTWLRPSCTIVFPL